MCLFLQVCVGHQDLLAHPDRLEQVCLMTVMFSILKYNVMYLK